MSDRPCAVCGSWQRVSNGKGRGTRCGLCKRVYQRSRYWLNPEQERERARAWRAANRERARRAKRARKKGNP
ncbi:hypothetical protein [Streptomyces macrosporus]|uniref:GATA-type domain-containing protein n=1 Tax=Streptomyces macrosporus TaxID=44032 RepID=A0ABP5X8H0_9ACTN